METYFPLQTTLGIVYDLGSLKSRVLRVSLGKGVSTCPPPNSTVQYYERIGWGVLVVQLVYSILCNIGRCWAISSATTVILW